MTHLPMISTMLRTLRGLRPTLLLAFALLPGVLAHAQSVSVATPTLPGRGATSYVISSDRVPDSPDFSSALYNRWYIPAEVGITVTGGLSGQSGWWRARFRLVTTGGSPVNLESDDPSNWVTTAFQFISVPAFGSSPLTFTSNLVPDIGVRLDPNTSYRPQIEIQKWNSATSTWDTTHGPLDAATSYTFIHFVGPYSTDSSVNVVARLNNLSWNRRYAVNTAAGSEDFRLTANINLYRYDEPHLGLTGTSDSVPYRFTFALYDTTNLVTPIATATTTTSFTTSLARNVNSGGITAPSVILGLPPINFRPASGVQLDSPNKTYRVVVTISHQEVVVPSTYVSSTTRTTTDAQLLHFNGRVLFGAGGTQVVTTANQISGDPASGAVDMGAFLNTTLTIPADQGSINASPSYTFGGAIPVSLLANGDAVCSGGSFAVTAPAFPDATVHNKLRFARFNSALNNAGLFSDVVLYLPSGLGWASTATKKQLTGSVLFDNVQLLSNLLPASDLTYVPASNMWITEETKPLAYQADRLVWSVSSGQLEFPVTAPNRVVYHREAELAALDAAPVAASLKIKPSNEMYFRATDTIDSPIIYVKGGPSRDARLNVTLKFAPGSFYTHFPYAAGISWGVGSVMEIDGDRVVPGASGLVNVNPVQMSYGRNCSGESCASIADAAITLVPDSGRLLFTENGGLSGTGVLSIPIELRWGYIATLGNFAHRAGTFADGNFHMAGTFLRGDRNSADSKRGPGVILFSGSDLGSGLLTERPLTADYAKGFADYAGMNFRCGPPDAAASGYKGRSVLAGSSYGPYDLKNRSKYYARLGGVSGIHDKVFGTPENVSFYGYDVRLDNFGLAFLSSVNTESRTEGELFVKDPSDIAQPFEELLFACNGALLSAEVPGGTNAQNLAYWNAPIDISAIEFVRNESDACNPGVGYLTLGVAGYASHVRETLFGTLGFLSNGNLIPQSFGLANVDSRLRMPAQTTIRGPKKQTAGGGYEEYTVTPVVDAYFNQLGSGPSFTPPVPASRVPEDGFITFAAYFKVPFFEALEVHVQTGSNRPPEDPDEASTPWSLSTLYVANGSWSGSSYFDGSYFDDSNRGLPPAVTPDAYRTTSTYYVHARQEWLGGSIEFDYPLVWNSSTRSFKSPETVENDFVVIQIEHEVKYLSADRLEITFGAQYDGLPQINLTNFVFNAIDDATGMAQATIEALTQSLVDQLNDGIDRMAELLNDQMDAFFERILGATLDPFVDAVYADLSALWTGGTWSPATVNGVIALRFDPNGLAGSLKGDVFARLRDVSGGAVDTIDIILENIQKIQDALDAVAEIAIPSNPEVKDYTKDLAAKLVEKLATQINGNLASILGGAGAYEKIANLLDPILNDLEPTLNQIRDVLVEMKSAFDEIKAQIDPAIGGAQEFLTEMRDIFQTANNLASGEFGDISASISLELDAGSGFFSGFGTGAGKKNFLSYTPDEIKQRIRQEISDRLMASTYVTRVQETIKQQIQDLANSVTTASDTVFAQINEAVKGVIGGALSEIDNTINGLLGDISDYMGAGKITGYAYFQGSGLRKVRLDGEFVWEIPKETTLKAYLEINQYTSEGEGPACTNPLPANMTFTEVIIGAKDVGCGFIGLDIKVDVEVKLSFEGSNAPWSLRPVGVAGSFAMTEGELSFEAFTITDLAAGVAFGKYENYITASLGMKIGNYGARGGIFFGRTCTIDPIKLWDPFAAEALGDPNPTFTGAYVYGEMHIPVSEAILGIPATCFFQITADAGMGIFYFLEGPTWGGRLALGVDGEVLCLLSVGGRIDMIGFKSGERFKLKGKGSVYAEIGWCDFCAKVSKSVTMETEVGADGGMKGGQKTK